MYKKVNEEKNILELELTKLESIISKYEKQVKSGASTLKTNHDNLQVARNDLQALRLETMNQKQQIDELEKRNEELYAQVNTMV